MANVVVLGAGYAGSTVASDVERIVPDARVTVVEPRSAFVHKYAAARAAAYGEEFSHLTIIPHDNLLQRGQFIQQEVTTVTADVVELADGQVLSFDVLVCATGGRNSFGEPPLSVTDVDGMNAYYNDACARVDTARDIVIVGGGPVGIELVGEIADRHPDKNVHLVTSRETLLWTEPRVATSMSDGLLQQMKDRNVQVALGTRVESIDVSKPFSVGELIVDLSDGKKLQADLVINCVGFKRNTSMYPRAWLNDDGAIRVNGFLQVEGTSNIFAIGDINDVPEIKMGQSSIFQANVAAKNIRVLVNGRSKLKAYRSSGVMMVVAFGMMGGRVQFGRLRLGSFFASRMKGRHMLVADGWKLNRQPVPSMPNLSR